MAQEVAGSPAAAPPVPVVVIGLPAAAQRLRQAHPELLTAVLPVPEPPALGMPPHYAPSAAAVFYAGLEGAAAVAGGGRPQPPVAPRPVQETDDGLTFVAPPQDVQAEVSEEVGRLFAAWQEVMTKP